MKNPFFGARQVWVLQVVLGFLGLLAVLFYVWQARAWIADLYAGKASEALMSFVAGLYPRFEVEKHRFALAFFLQKADQVVLRFALVWSVVVVWLVPLVFQSTAPQKVPRLACPTHPSAQYFCYYFTALALFFTWDWFWELAKLEEARFLYQPVFLLKLLHLPFPTWQASLGLCLGLWGSALGVSWAGKWRVHSAVVFAGLFVVLQGYQMSFYKIDHHFALFTYWACLMPFVLWEVRTSTLPAQTAWVLKLALALPYTIAGVEKIAVAGTAWLQPDTLQAYLRLHGQAWGLWVAEYAWLCGLLSVGMVLFELGFVLVVFYKWARWLFLPLGILFHLSTYILMDVGAWIHPWWLCYGVFLWNFKNEK